MFDNKIMHQQRPCMFSRRLVCQTLNGFRQPIGSTCRQKSQRNIFNSMKTAIFILAFLVRLALVRGLYFTSRLQGKSQPSSVAQPGPRCWVEGVAAHRADVRKCTDELLVSFQRVGPWDEYKFIIETLRVETVGCIQHRGRKTAIGGNPNSLIKY